MRTLLLFLLSCVTAMAEPTVNELVLVNGSTGQGQPANGGTLPEGVLFYVRAKVNAETLSVTFVITPGKTEVQPVTNGQARTSSGQRAVAGTYVVTAKPWSKAGATGTAGAEVRATYTITSAASPSPTATPATPTPTPTIAPTPTATPSATPSPTPTATPTPVPTATPTPIPTATPSPSPSPTPTPSGPLVTVTVEWTATRADEYSIFYGKTPEATDMQVYGGHAWADGPMCVAVANLEPDTTYYFSNAVTWYEVTGPRLEPPVTYTTTSALNQTVTLP